MKLITNLKQRMNLHKMYWFLMAHLDPVENDKLNCYGCFNCYYLTKTY